MRIAGKPGEEGENSRYIFALPRVVYKIREEAPERGRIQRVWVSGDGGVPETGSSNPRTRREFSVRMTVELAQRPAFLQKETYQRKARNTVHLIPTVRCGDGR